MAARRINFILDRELEVKTTLRDIFFTDLHFQQKFIDETLTITKTTDMELVNCIQFTYLGTTRYVICDLDTRFEQMQSLVAKTFRLPDECIPAIQFTDGLNHIFTKELFEYFILLFPQPQRKFFVRLELGKIIENRNAQREGTQAPASSPKNTNKRTHCDMSDSSEEPVVAAPLRRSNCFLGAFPEDLSVEEEALEPSQLQPRKRMRLMKSVKKTPHRISKVTKTKRVLRL